MLIEFEGVRSFFLSVVVKNAFGGITELAALVAGELDLYKVKKDGDTKSKLRIIEIEFIEK